MLWSHKLADEKELRRSAGEALTLPRPAALLLGMQDADGFNSGHYRYGSLSWQQTKIEAISIVSTRTLK